MGYKIEYDPSLVDRHGKLSSNVPEEFLRKLKIKIAKIAEVGDTYPHKYLTGPLQGFCKVRCSDYRIVYSVNHETKTIEIHRIGNRSNVYG